MKRLALICLTLFAAICPAAERKPRIAWATAVRAVKGEIEPAEAKPGQTVTFKLSVRLFPDHWTYPTNQSNPKEKDARNVFVLPAAADLIFVEPIRDPA